ncbi:MAG TPA: hypothetical protein PLR26_07675 [Bacilli bacterium]|nr:hypothetical protein [Bacilli bacterium]
MFGKKKELLTIAVLTEIIKKSNDDLMKSVEKFESDNEHISILYSNDVGNKLQVSISKIKRKYVYMQQMTGRQPIIFDSKQLLDLASFFPIAPETKKTLKKKYK